MLAPLDCYLAAIRLGEYDSALVCAAAVTVSEIAARTADELTALRPRAAWTREEAFVPVDRLRRPRLAMLRRQIETHRIFLTPIAMPPEPWDVRMRDRAALQVLSVKSRKS